MSPVDPAKGIIRGRKHGGVALLWHRSLENWVKPIQFQYDWLSGITLNINNVKFHFIGVYFPCDSVLNEEKFHNYVGVLASLIEEFSCGYVFIMGDFNVDFKRSSSCGNILLDFVKDSGLKVADTHLLSSDTLTFTSSAWTTTSWLDHCLCTARGYESIKYMEILYKYISSDHKPLSFTIECKINVDCSKLAADSGHASIDWSKLALATCEEYRSRCDTLLKTISIPHDAVLCRETSCKDPHHIESIDRLYSEIISSMKIASKSLVTNKSISKKPIVPGWNAHVRRCTLTC